MDNLTNILLWVGMISGGLMIFLLMLSILFGLDGDIDIDGGGVEVDGGDVDFGGLGIVKSGLTFFSMASFTARAIVLNSDLSLPVVILSGIIGGVIAVFLLAKFFKFLLKQQEDGNYEFWEAEGKVGKVYIPIPKDGIGKITVEINGVNREVPAKSETGVAIGTNQKVLVLKAEDNFLVVTKVDA